MENKIVIISTDSRSDRGGIATSVKNSSLILKERGMEFKLLISSRSGSSKIYLLIIFLRVVSKILFGSVRNKIFYLHVGPNTSLIRKLFIASLIKLKNGRLMVKYHSPEFYSYLKLGGLGFLGLYFLSRLSDRNIALNGYWKRIFERGLKVKFFVLANPIIERPGIKRNVNNSGGIKLITGGRIVKEKNIQEILSFVFFNKKYKLQIFGDGPYLSNLKEMVSCHNAFEQIEFLGWVENDRVCQLIGESSVFVLPSQYDSFGMVYLESLSVGTPIIAPKILPVMSTLKGLVGVRYANTQDQFEDSISLLLNCDPSEVSKSLFEKFGKDQYLRNFEYILSGL